MIRIDDRLAVGDLLPALEKFWDLSAEKILSVEKGFDPSLGSPVFTAAGKYTTRGWTEWTRGFKVGSALLQFDATGERRFLELGRQQTRREMAVHISHTGVHDHGFNIISTYGNLLRLMNEGKIPHDEGEKDHYELALKLSGAVQALRWTDTPDGGFIYSFNGPHSLFVDTIRSCRSLVVSHLLGHVLYGENDRPVHLLQRAADHLKSTARYSVYYGEGRDIYDVWGRVAHESIFNVNDGAYRCPSTQQGYSPFSTWTRGLAWAMLGFAEELEVFGKLGDDELKAAGGRERIEEIIYRGAEAACDFYLSNTPVDGIPYWDTGAPGLAEMGDYLERPADPYNDHEPVDSSAAVIAAQGLLRFGHYLLEKGEEKKGRQYFQAGLTVAQTLLEEPYLCAAPEHQGLILHSVYHRPNGWDYIPEGSRIPRGESGMWGDYHARELMLYLYRLARGDTYYTFYNGLI